jgi:hypothetical protein
LAAARGLSPAANSRRERDARRLTAAASVRWREALGRALEHGIRRDPLGLTTVTPAQAATRVDGPVARRWLWLRAGVLAGVLAGTRGSGQRRALAVVVVALERSGRRCGGYARRLDPRYRG